MTRPGVPSFPESIHVTVESVHPSVPGVAPGSVVAESEWLPIIGPTAWLLARRLVRDGGSPYLTADLARDLGVQPGKVWSTLRSLQHFKLAAIESENGSDPAVVTVRNRWPRRLRSVSP